MTEKEKCALDQCNQHSGLKVAVDNVVETLKHISKKTENYYPRELVYIIGLLCIQLHYYQ